MAIADDPGRVTAPSVTWRLSLNSSYVAGLRKADLTSLVSLCQGMPCILMILIPTIP